MWLCTTNVGNVGVCMCVQIDRESFRLVNRHPISIFSNRSSAQDDTILFHTSHVFNTFLLGHHCPPELHREHLCLALARRTPSPTSIVLLGKPFRTTATIIHCNTVPSRPVIPFLYTDTPLPRLGTAVLYNHHQRDTDVPANGSATRTSS